MATNSEVSKENNRFNWQNNVDQEKLKQIWSSGSGQIILPPKPVLKPSPGIWNSHMEQNGANNNPDW